MKTHPPVGYLAHRVSAFLAHPKLDTASWATRVLRIYGRPTLPGEKLSPQLVRDAQKCLAATKRQCADGDAPLDLAGPLDELCNDLGKAITRAIVEGF